MCLIRDDYTAIYYTAIYYTAIYYTAIYYTAIYYTAIYYIKIGSFVFNNCAITKEELFF